jgi:integrase/recombinase XerD
MAAARSFADMLAQFLTIYLLVTRGCSPNTISAYRDAFTLFLRFMDHQQATSPDKVSFTDFTEPNVAAFIGWLRTDRQCSTATTNQRLAALKSFFRYVQAHAPEQIAQAQQVLGIKAAQAPEPAIGYLPVEAIGLLLEHATRRWPRDLALLTTLYDTGARAQEACDLSIGDLHLGKPASATLTGKGQKTRIVPLAPQAVQILTQHVRTLPHDPSRPVFTNRAGKRLGRAGVAYLLARCMHAAHAERPELVPEKISPHLLCHSKVIYTSTDAGVPVDVLRDLMDHVSIQTTSGYYTNPQELQQMQEKALVSWPEP